MWVYQKVIRPKETDMIMMANSLDSDQTSPEGAVQSDLGTVMIISFRTDRSGQTVQTQIRLLLPRSDCSWFNLFVQILEWLQPIFPGV